MCDNCVYWKDKFYDLKDEYNDVLKELRKTENKLESAEFRIRNELEPIIQRERNSYDKWVTDPER